MKNQTSNDSSAPLPWWMWLSLAAMGLSTYWSSVGFDFVNLDDISYVSDNDLIQSWSPKNLLGIASQPVTRNYAPLTIFSFLMDHSVWGMNPSGYHATNVLLHLVNGMLVLVLVSRLTGSRFVGWATAAMFLIHPVQIETVAWVSSRKGLLSATFMLGALIVRLRDDSSGRTDLFYICLLSAALLSKALAVVIPAIVLLYDTRILKKEFGQSLARQFVPGLLCLLLLLKTMGAQSSVLGGLRDHMSLSTWHILAVDASILWQYVGMLLLPKNLCVFYDPETELGLQTVLSLAAWGFVGFVAYRRRKQNPLMVWATVVALLLLLPVLNLYRITTLMNDRYLYLPSICFFGFLFSSIERLVLVEHTAVRRLGMATKWATALTVSCVGMLATWNHLPTWKNSTALWDHAMTQVPQLTMVRVQKALTLYGLGQCRAGIRELHNAMIKTEPDDLDRRRISAMIRQWNDELKSGDIAKAKSEKY